jgi:hypothetical protein
LEHPEHDRRTRYVTNVHANRTSGVPTCFNDSNRLKSEAQRQHGLFPSSRASLVDWLTQIDLEAKMLGG